MQDRSVEVEVTALFTIGAIDGAGWETFSDVAAVAFDGAGRLVILDAGNDRLVQVDEDGRLVRVIGRSGRGPGELTRPTGMAVTAAGEIVVFDMGSGAFTVYDTAGVFLRQLRPPVGRGFPGRRLRAHPRGGVVAASGDGQALQVPGEAEPRACVLNWYPLESAADPIEVAEAWCPERQSSPGAGTSTVRDRRVGVTALPALAPRLLFDVLGDGRVVFSDSTTYEIDVCTPGSAGSQLFGRPIPPRSTTAQDRRDEIERRRARLNESTSGVRLDSRRSLQRQMDDLEFWPERAVISRLRVATDGLIWVERRPEDDGPPPIDLLRTDGVYVGTIRSDALRVPDALGPGGLAAFVEAGELGEPRVRVVRVE
ncbi:MAG: 6-bladed beta-propeller [Gemmatimonadales bacterium]